MHPTGRDCFGPPTLNRFWTCLCQRIDPKRGVARRGRAFIPDHSGLRAPFSADVRTRAADPGPRVTRLRHSPVARVALHDAPPGPFRLFRHAFGFRPVMRFRVSGRSRIAAARRPDWRFGRRRGRPQRCTVGGLTDARKHRGAARGASLHGSIHGGVNTATPSARVRRAPAQPHAPAWLVAVKPTPPR